MTPLHPSEKTETEENLTKQRISNDLAERTFLKATDMLSKSAANVDTLPSTSHQRPRVWSRAQCHSFCLPRTDDIDILQIIQINPPLQREKDLRRLKESDLTPEMPALVLSKYLLAATYKVK